MSEREVRPIDILLADDNEDDIIMIRDAFQDAKLINIVADVRDGEEAIDYLKRQGKHTDAKPVGLLLLDINMPRKNGFEVLHEVKNDPKLKHLPVIMLTTSDREEDIKKSYEEGACSFITKPVSFNKFSEVIKEFSFYWALISRIPEDGR